MQRFRITYAKQDALRYTGNLDMQKVWERYLRRAELPVAYSQGFHPQPKIQQACPLPLGFFSTSEITDIWLEDDSISAAAVQQKLTTTNQPGIEVKSVTLIALTSPALQSVMVSVIYQVEGREAENHSDFDSVINKVLSSPFIMRERRGKPYDLRPLIEDLTLVSEDSQNKINLRMRLAAREGATGRPEEVLAELGISSTQVKITRTALIYHELTPVHQ